MPVDVAIINCSSNQQHPAWWKGVRRMADGWPHPGKARPGWSGAPGRAGAVGCVARRPGGRATKATTAFKCLAISPPAPDTNPPRSPHSPRSQRTSLPSPPPTLSILVTPSARDSSAFQSSASPLVPASIPIRIRPPGRRPI
jgi:hypothetical protein